MYNIVAIYYGCCADFRAVSKGFQTGFLIAALVVFFFISPGAEIYKGQVIGEHTRNDDLSINVIKGKKLTNMRTQSTDAAVQIEPKIDF